MTGQIVIRSSPVALNRRQPLLTGTLTLASTPTPSRVSNVGELAGGTTAGCLVVCCCCPCVLFECLYLAVYKVPATICRRFWMKSRRKIAAKKKRILHHAAETTPEMVVSGEGEKSSRNCYCDELSDVDMKEFEKIKVSIDGSDDAIQLDKQMWDQFQNAGFWRSPSQRHT